MQKKVRKAVFPVAGLGTRFLPATKANPKEMMAVVDKPLIQYAVEEAIAAGIDELIFVTSHAKRAIEDHFDKNYELEAKLKEKGKKKLLEQVRNLLPSHVNVVYVRQQEALGLGHAVLCAKHLIHDEPFAVLLADDLIDGNGKPCLKQMVEVYERQGHGVLAVQQVPAETTDQYGIVAIDGNHHIQKIVEKPKPADAPSQLGVVGRYILPGSIFELLEQTQRGSGGEIQLTDAIADLLKTEPVVAYPFDGIRYDCGSRLGFLQANLELGLKHPDCGERWAAYLQKRMS